MTDYRVCTPSNLSDRHFRCLPLNDNKRSQSVDQARFVRNCQAKFPDGFTGLLLSNPLRYIYSNSEWRIHVYKIALLPKS